MAPTFSTRCELGNGILVTGSAGVGKTHYLASLIDSIAADLAMEDFQVVPVLSAMHGARRRLAARLAAIQTECSSRGMPLFLHVSTLDAFALSLVMRLQGRSEGDGLPDFESGDFSPTHRAASKALSSDSIGRMCAASFPLILIDELQDCRGTQLEFVRDLARWVPVVAAADPFQVLDPDGASPAVDWARSTLAHVDLGVGSARTNNPGILTTAHSLRSGTFHGHGVHCAFAAAPAIAAKIVMETLRTRWPRGTTAMLSYKCSDSPFVEQILHALTKPRALTDAMQPLPFVSVASQRQEQQETKRCMSHLPDTLSVIAPRDQYRFDVDQNECWSRCIAVARRRGVATVSKEEFLAELQRQSHFRRSFGTRSAYRVLLSIHGAKNQEWDNVVVLWSRRHFRANSPEALKRRLLYNAVTRAKRRCLIIAEGPAHEWEGDPLLGLLGHPTPTQIENSRNKRRPKQSGAKPSAAAR